MLVIRLQPPILREKYAHLKKVNVNLEEVIIDMYSVYYLLTLCVRVNDSICISGVFQRGFEYRLVFPVKY